MIVRGFLAGPVSAVASPARQRSQLVILNQSFTETIWIAFDQPAVAAQVPGQVTLAPLNPTGAQVDNAPGLVFRGDMPTIPWVDIHIVASSTDTPVTIFE